MVSKSRDNLGPRTTTGGDRTIRTDCTGLVDGNMPKAVRSPEASMFIEGDVSSMPSKPVCKVSSIPSKPVFKVSVFNGQLNRHISS